MLKTLKELMIQWFSFQLVVPAFKARHISWSYMEHCAWVEQYAGQDVEALELLPAISRLPHDSVTYFVV